jgi:NAD+ kinase
VPFAKEIGSCADQVSYVEDTLEHNKIFDAEGILSQNPELRGRLRFWNNELCAQKPQTFDIVLAVSASSL